MILNSSNHTKKHEKMTITQKFNTLDTDVASYEAGASQDTIKKRCGVPGRYGLTDYTRVIE